MPLFPLNRHPDPDEAEAQDSHPAQSRNPLIAIGIVVLIMLSIPLLLYPIVPEDTLKAGHVVFASGKQTVYFQTPGRYQQHGFRNSCVLEANAPLVIVHPALELSGGALVAKARGEASHVEFPFCPPQAEILVHPHQIIKKRTLLSLLKEFLSGLLPS